MRKNSKTAAILFSLLFAAVISLTAFTEPVSADADNGLPVDKKALSMKASGTDEEIEGRGVHADPATFEKNFCLSADQKEYVITQCEKVISLYTEPEMSDLQKYYEIAKWANARVVYDNDFWSGHYVFDYYSHQWDAYGAMKEDEKSVCAGIAIFYANLCHAADLPCRFVRFIPQYLDHTITYIPDINGNAYYADITENEFLVSQNASGFGSDIDKPFANITKDPVDGSFEYLDQNDILRGADIKECWQNKVSYKDWFREFALHKGTDKSFSTAYVEKGSGTYGTHYASYQNFDKYPAQSYASRTSAVTGIWFLDDFYQEPAEAKAKILNKEFDEQFLNISGVKKNYDCKTTADLEAAVKADISIRYFPSVENGEVVAKAARLTNGEDYSVTYDSHDNATGEEVLTIQGTADYTGACQIRVRMNSAVVKTDPIRINGLIYNGSPQNLVEPGAAENGTMVYAVCEPGMEPKDGDYTEAIPTGSNVGKYDVWYKVNGDANHSDMPAQKLERAVKIAAQPLDDQVKLSKLVFTYNGKVQKPSVRSAKLKEGTDYTLSWGNAKSKNAGAYGLIIDGKGSYCGSLWLEYTIKKAANPMTIKAKTATVKRSKVKKKAQTIKRANAITVKKAKGKKTYKLISAKKGKKSFKNKFKINAKTGNVTVKRGLKKGTYKVKVKVKAAGTANYKASAWKNVTFKVKVR